MPDDVESASVFSRRLHKQGPADMGQHETWVTGEITARDAALKRKWVGKCLALVVEYRERHGHLTIAEDRIRALLEESGE